MFMFFTQIVVGFKASNVIFLVFYILGELQAFEHNRLCQMSVERVELASLGSNARVFS